MENSTAELNHLFYYQITTGVLATLSFSNHQNQVQPKFQKRNFGQSILATGIIKKEKQLFNKSLFISCVQIQSFFFFFYTGTCLLTKIASPSVPQTRYWPSTSKLLTDSVWLGSMWVVSRRPLLESPLSQALMRDWFPPAGAMALCDIMLLFLLPEKQTTALHFIGFCHTLCHTLCHVTEVTTTLGQPELKCLLMAEGNPCKTENMWLHTDGHWAAGDSNPNPDMLSLPSF